MVRPKDNCVDLGGPGLLAFAEDIARQRSVLFPVEQMPSLVRDHGQEICPARDAGSAINGHNGIVHGKGRQAGACPAFTVLTFYFRLSCRVASLRSRHRSIRLTLYTDRRAAQFG